MKASTKRKAKTFVKKVLPFQALLVGAYVEIDWIFSQWETVRAFVSTVLRAVGIAG